jgi:glycerophosphoryl diester phosphodiesterase
MLADDRKIRPFTFTKFIFFLSLFQTYFVRTLASVYLQNGQCPLQVPTALRANNPTELSSHHRRPSLITIAHRGASFSLPEHSLPAYRLALELGADYIEPDLVATKDRRLIAVHSFDLNITTNIQHLYPDRHRVVEKNGKEISGYFAFDFTLQELESVRVKQRIEGRSRAFDYLFPIPTLQDILHLLHEWNAQVHPLIEHQAHRAGVYIELKAPAFHLESFNISLADLFLEEMGMFPHSDEMFFNQNEKTTFGCEEPNGYQVPPLVLQCFHGDTMRYLHDELMERKMALPPFVYLVEKKNCHSLTFWDEVGRMNFLSGIGPDKECLLGEEGYQFSVESKKLNLAVHPWTTRDELEFVNPEFSSAQDELRYLYCERGISGMFTENVDLAIKVGLLGCDDFSMEQEIIHDGMSRSEDKDDERLNSTITLSKESCNRKKGGDSILIALGSVATGLMMGLLISIFSLKKLRSPKRGGNICSTLPCTENRIQRGKMKGMQTLSTVSDDDDDDDAAEII